MASDILNFRFRAAKCPVRAALGHVKNSQVPLKNSLVLCLKAIWTLRAVKNPILYINIYFSHVSIYIQVP